MSQLKALKLGVLKVDNFLIAYPPFFLFLKVRKSPFPRIIRTHCFLIQKCLKCANYYQNLAAYGRTFSTGLTGLTRFFSIFILKILSILSKKWKFLYFKFNEPPRGKPRGIFKGKINFIAASCGELNSVDFASLLK